MSYTQSVELRTAAEHLEQARRERDLTAAVVASTVGAVLPELEEMAAKLTELDPSTIRFRYAVEFLATQVRANEAAEHAARAAATALAEVRGERR